MDMLLFGLFNSDEGYEGVLGIPHTEENIETLKEFKEEASELKTASKELDFSGAVLMKEMIFPDVHNAVDRHSEGDMEAEKTSGSNCVCRNWNPDFPGMSEVTSPDPVDIESVEVKLEEHKMLEEEGFRLRWNPEEAYIEWESEWIQFSDPFFSEGDE